MHPNTIQMYDAVPNLAPIMAPNIGPSPAMLRNWIMKIFQVGIGTKSIPSVLVYAGVLREESGEKRRSMYFP